MTADEFKAMRERAGMTQQAIADFLSVDIRSAQRYEYGESEIQGSVLRLCEILDAVGTTERLTAIMNRERNRR